MIHMRIWDKNIIRRKYIDTKSNIIFLRAQMLPTFNLSNLYFVITEDVALLEPSLLECTDF